MSHWVARSAIDNLFMAIHFLLRCPGCHGLLITTRALPHITSSRPFDLSLLSDVLSHICNLLIMTLKKTFKYLWHLEPSCPKLFVFVVWSSSKLSAISPGPLLRLLKYGRAKTVTVPASLLRSFPDLKSLQRIYLSAYMFLKWNKLTSVWCVNVQFAPRSKRKLYSRPVWTSWLMIFTQFPQMVKVLLRKNARQFYNSPITRFPAVSNINMMRVGPEIGRNTTRCQVCDRKKTFRRSGTLIVFFK